MFRRRWLALPVALATLFVGLSAAGSGVNASGPFASPVPPLLVDIRAAQHDGFDRVVFEFVGGMPDIHTVRAVDQVTAPWTGDPVEVTGNAFLEVTFADAVGHEAIDQAAYGPRRRTYALPNVMEVVNSFDAETVLGFGIGLAVDRPFTVSVLDAPDRLIIDIDTAFRTVPVRNYLTQRGTKSVVAVSRPVVPPATAKGALQRLFLGPTQQEMAAGLTLVRDGVTGFSNLSISQGIARVTLTGSCNTRGQTPTIADELMPTLKQFPSVQWVKIYGPDGQTAHPTGDSDSLPTCLGA